MCLIIFAHQADPDLPLVVAANRDEFFGRPTRTAQFWTSDDSQSQILAGKDLQAGGTWLGMSRGGRFAAVTNIRDPSLAEGKPRSRGELTLQFLQGSQSAAEYADSLRASFDQFAGYNLLISDGLQFYYVNNFEAICRELEPGVYGVSNGVLDNDWPKVLLGKEKLEKLMSKGASLATDDLIRMMHDREQAPEGELPDTGISKELERKLSSAFIAGDDRGYGTLCSTAVIQDKDGQIQFTEQNYTASGEPGENPRFNFIRD